MLQSVNPATEELVAEYPEHTDSEVQSTILQADRAFSGWKNSSFEIRARCMHKAAAVLRQRATELSQLMVQEMGKPVREAQAEIEKCAWVSEFFADRAEQFLAPETVKTTARRSYIRFDPLGVILAVMPWNFPFWQVFRFIAPTLMAGNTGLLKHASNVTGCALAIERVMNDAGFPEGVFSCLLIGSSRVRDVIRHPAIRAVSLTGSEAAGRSVAEVAGQCLKKCVLELGGSDPFIVLPDADIAAAARQAAKARTINSGQSCIAAKRFIVVDAVADEFVRALVHEMNALNVGDPQLEETQVGPLARKDLRDELRAQVHRSIEAGARMVSSGTNHHGKGFFSLPTVLDRAGPGMPAFDEELFGPVAAVIRVRDTEAALVHANQSRFGLGASIWTRNLPAAEQLAASLECGTVFINDIVKSDPRLPFGGVKDSGFGRELSHFGIREFVNIKSIWIS